MSNYISTTIFENCPHCGKLLRLPAEVSWDDFKPEKFRCRHCGKHLSITAAGKVKKEEA